MTLRTTGRLLIACVVVGAAVAFVRWWDRRTPPPGTPSAPLLEVPAHELTWLRITVNGSTLECRRKGGQWFLGESSGPPAEEEAVERFLSTLDSLRPLDRITERQRRERELRFADFGLDPPTARVEFGYGSRRQRLDLGSDTWMGTSLYARLDDRLDVLVLPRQVREVLPRHVTDWRSRRLLTLAADRVVRLEIRRPGAPFLQLAIVQGRWFIQQPVPMRADETRVRTLLESLEAARVRRFVRDGGAPEVLSAPSAGATSDRPPDPQWELSADEAHRIAVWHRGEEMGREVWLGRPPPDAPEEVYARVRPGETVVTVDRALLEIFSLSPLDLRDRQLFALPPDSVRELRFREGDTRLVLERTHQGWALKEPFARSADARAVDTLLRRTIELSAVSFRSVSAGLLASAELDRAGRRIEMVYADSPPSLEGDLSGSRGTSTVQTLRLALEPDEGGLLWGQLLPDDVLCLIRQQDVQSLDIFPLAAHRFIDRTILAIPPETVRRVTLRRDGKEQTVELAEHGGWVAVDPKEARVRHGHVREVLRCLEQLRAKQAVAGPDDPTGGRGLRDPWALLCVGLTGAGDIQKVLRFGAPAGKEGVWVNVQGEEVVYILDEDTVQTLTADLVETDASGGPKRNLTMSPAS